MPKVHADLRIEARYIVPMTSRGAVLEEHCIVVRDGRILDVLPVEESSDRYTAAAVLQRPEHVILPGFINANLEAGMTPTGDVAHPAFTREQWQFSIGQMLKAGTTCFCDRFGTPEQTALAAAEQGIRAVVGVPVARDLTQALRLRDALKDRPLVSTVFAAPSAADLDQAALLRILTLADELDAVLLIDLHRSAAEVARCAAAHGKRPIEWLQEMGALTPALSAVHAADLTDADLEIVRTTGVAVIVCPQASLATGLGSRAVLAQSGSGVRVGLGSASGSRLSADLWGDLRLAGLTSGNSWAALHAAIRGGAEALNLDALIGSAAPGYWADLCCISLAGANVHSTADVVDAVVLRGGRDWVSDTWVAGRALLTDGELTRLDWTALLARIQLHAAAVSPTVQA
jgi:5-methylthioadenosine/S-adenosylhomocysteine deaminase